MRKLTRKNILTSIAKLNCSVMRWKMNKVEIIRNGTEYLHGFEPNETYVAQKRAIQSTLHDASEYNSVWSEKPKSYDLITARGYMQMLCEEMRWTKFEKDENREIVLKFFPERR